MRKKLASAIAAMTFIGTPWVLTFIDKMSFLLGFGILLIYGAIMIAMVRKAQK